MKYLLIIFLFFSCAKSVDNHNSISSSLIKTHTILESKYLIKDLGITTLTIRLNPVLTCYTYLNGQAPRPCDIFIDLICTLSRPIDGAIRVELIKLNMEMGGRIPNGEKVDNVVLIIAPNTTQITMKSTMTNQNNQNIPDLFRIVNAVIYQPID